MPSLFIVLEKKTRDLDQDVNGNYLSKYNDELESIAKRAGVTPLMNFFSASKDELTAFAEQSGVQLPATKLPDEAWFTAADGLRTVKALLQNVAALNSKHASRVESELLEFARVLELAEANGVRWHLAIDY